MDKVSILGRELLRYIFCMLPKMKEAEENLEIQKIRAPNFNNVGKLEAMYTQNVKDYSISNYKLF